MQTAADQLRLRVTTLINPGRPPEGKHDPGRPPVSDGATQRINAELTGSQSPGGATSHRVVPPEYPVTPRNVDSVVFSSAMKRSTDGAVPCVTQLVHSPTDTGGGEEADDSV